MSNSLPWKVTHIDLSQVIPPLNPEPGYAGVYLVVWWRTLPLGQLEIWAEQLPLSSQQLLVQVWPAIAPDIRAQLQHYGQEPQILAEKPLAQLWQYWNQPQTSPVPKVSVVICTRDRPEQLADCLRSLQQLSVAPHEILVVDNAPHNNATQQRVSEMPGIRYVREPSPGLSIARNTGVRYSTGDVIAFTDDDVMVAPDWVDRLCRSFQNPQVMAVTGLVLPKELETEAQILFEMEHGCLRGNYRSRLFDSAFFQHTLASGVPVWHIGAGANMAFRRSVFQEVGVFDSRLGAGASGCSEDSEFWYRILAAGGTCLYEPAIVVYHCHRRELQQLRSQMYQYMRGHVTALLIQFARYRHWGNLYRLFWELPRHYRGRLIKGLFTGFRGKYRTTPSEVLGCFAGVWFYLRYCIWVKNSSQAEAKIGNSLSETNIPAK